MSETFRLSELQYVTKWRLPAGVYIYGEDGYASAWCETELQFDRLKPAITRAIRDGREVRITNGGDELMFHANYGAMLFCVTDFSI